MNVANKISVSRIALTFIFMFFVFGNGVLAKVSALLTFLLASFTDLVDGYVAKTRNMVTDAGKILDPIADKILVLASFMAFVEMGLIPAWMVVLIVLREVAITGLRVTAFSQGRVIPADAGGKHKMVSQVIAIITILVFLICREAGIKTFQFWNESIERVYKDAIFCVMLITMTLTVISGVVYFAKNKGAYLNEEKD